MLLGSCRRKSGRTVGHALRLKGAAAGMGRGDRLGVTQRWQRVTLPRGGPSDLGRRHSIRSAASLRPSIAAEDRLDLTQLKRSAVVGRLVVQLSRRGPEGGGPSRGPSRGSSRGSSRDPVGACCLPVQALYRVGVMFACRARFGVCGSRTGPDRRSFKGAGRGKGWMAQLPVAERAAGERFKLLHVQWPAQMFAPDARFRECGGRGGLAAYPEDAASWACLLPAPQEPRVGEWDVLQVGEEAGARRSVNLEQLDGVVGALDPARGCSGRHEQRVHAGEAGRGEDDDPGAGHAAEFTRGEALIHTIDRGSGPTPQSGAPEE